MSTVEAPKRGLRTMYSGLARWARERSAGPIILFSMQEWNRSSREQQNLTKASLAVTAGCALTLTLLLSGARDEASLIPYGVGVAVGTFYSIRGIEL